MSQTGPLLSTQDLQDLYDIRSRLPQGDPRIAKIDAAVQTYEKQPTEFERERTPQEGMAGAIGNDIAGLGSSLVHTVAHPIDTAKQMMQSVETAPQRFQERKQEGYSLPYRLAAGTAETLLPVNVQGMEQAAQHGDPGAVLGHAVTGGVTSLAPIGLKHLPEIPRVRAVQNFVGDNFLDKSGNPLSVGQIPTRLLQKIFPPSADQTTLLDRQAAYDEMNKDIQAGQLERAAARNEAYNDLGERRINRGTEQDALNTPQMGKISEGPTAAQHAAVRAGQRAVLAKNARGVIPRAESPVTPELGSPQNPGLVTPLPETIPNARTGPQALRPVVFASPEEAASYDVKKRMLENEARDTGLYSAARGKVGKKLDYQQRANKAFNNR